jgi:WD40 repeat protein
MISGGGSRIIRVWNLQSHKVVREIAIDKPRADREVTELRCSRDGKTIWGLVDSVLYAIDANTAKARFHDVDHFSLSLDAKSVAVGFTFGPVRFFKLKADKELFPSGTYRPCDAVSVTADGNRLLTFHCLNQPLRVWDAERGRELHRLSEPLGVFCVSCSPNGQLVALGSADGVYLWETRTGKVQLLRERLGWVAFSADGKNLFVCGDGELEVWDAKARKKVTLPEGRSLQGHLLAVSPDKKLLALHDEGEKRISLVDSTTWTIRDQLPGKGCRALAFSPNGKYLAALVDVELYLWDTQSLGRLWTYTVGGRGDDHEGRNLLAFSADSCMLAYPRGNGVGVLEIASGEVRHRFAGHDGAVTSVAFLADGKRVVSASEDRTVLAWDLNLADTCAAKVPYTDKDLNALWKDLGSDDALEAYKALCRLVLAPKEAVPYLSERVRGEDKVGLRVRRCIRDLNDDDFERRNAASEELLSLGYQALPCIEEALRGKLPVEVEKRCRQLHKELVKQLPPPAVLQRLRGIEALERIGTEAARQALEEVGKGSTSAVETQRAQEAIGRLSARKAGARP